MLKFVGQPCSDISWNQLVIIWWDCKKQEQTAPQLLWLQIMFAMSVGALKIVACMDVKSGSRSRRLPFGSVGADKIWLDHRKVTVLFSDPRMLALRVQLRGCSLLVISGHAPHEGDDAQTKDYWWQRLHGVLSKHSRLGRVIILGDFNARLGRQVGQITGALQDVQTNDNGERLLEFCEEYFVVGSFNI